MNFSRLFVINVKLPGDVCVRSIKDRSIKAKRETVVLKFQIVLQIF